MTKRGKARERRERKKEEGKKGGMEDRQMSRCVRRSLSDCAVFQVSRDGGAASPATEGRGGGEVEGGRMALDNKTSLLNTQPPRAFPGPRAREYNPYPYSDTINTYDKTALKEAVFDDDMEQLRDGLSACPPLYVPYTFPQSPCLWSMDTNRNMGSPGPSFAQNCLLSPCYVLRLEKPPVSRSLFVFTL